MDKLKTSEMKTQLTSYSKDDLIRLVVELSQMSPEAQNYLTVELQGETAVMELFEEAKLQVRNEFFPEKGRAKLRLIEAKKAISEFSKYTNDRLLKTDLLLFYVEMGTDFTVAYGDMDEPYYNSMFSTFAHVAEICNEDEHIFQQLRDRMEVIISDARLAGWDTVEPLAESYQSIGWQDGEEA